MNQLAADLAATKRMLQTYGRCKDRMIDSDGRICVAHAACKAVYQMGDKNRYSAVMDALSAQLSGYRGFTESRDKIIDYNQEARVTDADLFMLFDKAIADSGGMCD